MVNMEIRVDFPLPVSVVSFTNHVFISNIFFYFFFSVSKIKFFQNNYDLMNDLMAARPNTFR